MPCLGVYPERIWKSTENINENVRSFGRNSKRTSLDYKSEVLPTEPPFPVEADKIAAVHLALSLISLLIMKGRRLYRSVLERA